MLDKLKIVAASHQRYSPDYCDSDTKKSGNQVMGAQLTTRFWVNEYSGDLAE